MRKSFRPGAAVAGLLALSFVFGACGGSNSSPEITTTTTLPSPQRVRLAINAACTTDPACLAGLESFYGLDFRGSIIPVRTVADELAAVRLGRAEVAYIRSSDALDDPDQYSVLVDDKDMAQPTTLVPIYRNDQRVVGNSSAIGIIDATLALLDDKTLLALNDDFTSTDMVTTSLIATAEDFVNAAFSDLAATPIDPNELGNQVPLQIGVMDTPQNLIVGAVLAASLRAHGIAAAIKPVDGYRDLLMAGFDAKTVDIAVDETAPLLDYLDGYTTPPADALAGLIPVATARGLVVGVPAPVLLRTQYVAARSVAQNRRWEKLSDIVALDSKSDEKTLPSLATPTTLTNATSTNATSTTVVATRPPIALLGPQDGVGLGANGDDVRAIQDELYKLGFFAKIDESSPTTLAGGALSSTSTTNARVTDPGAVVAPAIPTMSGSFDEPTRRALVAFQESQGLNATGVVDGPTREALGAPRISVADDKLPLAPGIGATLDPGAMSDGKKLIYLMFADGPDNTNTTLLLDLLDKHNAKASFLVQAQYAQRNSALINREVISGHTVVPRLANRGFVSSPSKALLTGELDALSALIQGVSGKTPRCVSPTYGATSAIALQTFAKREITPVAWNIDVQDWRSATTSDLVATSILENVKPGNVVLLHDGGGTRTQTLAAVDRVLVSLERSNWKFASLPDC